MEQARTLDIIRRRIQGTDDHDNGDIPSGESPSLPMIESLPEGKSIGTMQAPIDWVITHTSRFVGAVFITIQDGKGFILIEKGKPRGYYFQHEGMVLKGRTALDYFNKQQTIDFDLRKYTPEEFLEAVALYGGEESPVQTQTATPVTVSDRSTGKGAVPDATKTGPIQKVLPEMREVTAGPASVPGQGESDESRIREIIRQPGVEGVAIFRDGMEIMSTGHVNFRKARNKIDDRLHWGQKAASTMKKGPFLQITDQFENGDVIIAPFRDVFICVVTSSDASLGTIRSLIRGR